MGLLTSKGKLSPVLIGHVPLEISRQCYFFMKHAGDITARVINPVTKRTSPIENGGYEVLIVLKFTHNDAEKADIMKHICLTNLAGEYVERLVDERHSDTDIKSGEGGSLLNQTDMRS